MLHSSCILLSDLIRRFARNLAGDSQKVVLTVVQALGGCRGTPLDGTAARHVGLSSGDGGGCGLCDGEALVGLGSELLLRGELRFHGDGFCSLWVRLLLVVVVVVAELFLRRSVAVGGWFVCNLVLLLLLFSGVYSCVQMWKKSSCCIVGCKWQLTYLERGYLINLRLQSRLNNIKSKR
jgi:hypothetical protein